MERFRKLLWLGLPFGGVILALVFGWAVRPAYAQVGLISGQVTSPAGYPLPAGTLVKLFDPGETNLFGQAAPGLTDGMFSLGPVPNGLYLLKAVPPPGSGLTQSLPRLVSVVNNPVTGIQLALTEPQVIGTVLAPDALTPAEAFVRVYAGDGQVLQHIPAPGGAFLVGGLPAGGYWLQAYPEGEHPYWQSPAANVTIPGLSATQTLTLTLAQADLWGYVEDEQGVPVPTAAVVAAQSAGEHQVDHTGPTGYWAIGGLLTGTTYTVGAFPPVENSGLLPSAPLTLTLPAGGSPYMLVLDSPPKIVEGEVRTNTSLPVSQAQVSARRVNKAGYVEGLTGPDGMYELNLTPGLWALTVEAITGTVPADWVFPAPPQLVYFQQDNEPETQTQNFTVLTADAEVTGVVEMPDGSAPPFIVTVGVYNDEGIGRRTEIDPVDGSFSLPVPNGGYKVAVQPEDPGYLGPVVAPIQVPPNGSYDLDTVTLAAKDALITGTLHDENGAGVAGIPIAAWRPGTHGSEHTTSGPDGAYALAVTGETWHVQPAPGPQQAYLYVGAGTQVEVPAGGLVPDVDFDLVTADAIVTGVLVDETGVPVSDADGWATAVNTGDPATGNGAPLTHGTFKIFLPAGTYRVGAHLPPGSPYLSTGERQVTVASGETVRLALTVQEKNAVIAGALWDPRNLDIVEGVPGMVGAWQGPSWAAAPIHPGNGAYRLGVADGLWFLNYRISSDSGYVKISGPRTIPLEAGQTAGVPLPIIPKDALIAGTVLDPDGNLLPGVVVLVKGLGGEVRDLWLQTRTDPNGEFALQVPYGRYHLGAAGGEAGWIKPVEAIVSLPPGGISDGHVLQFQLPDAVVNGVLTVENTPVGGAVHVWAWSDDGGFTQGRFPVSPGGGQAAGLYSLDVISGTVWHLGAAFETPNHYWFDRAAVPVTSIMVTQDLVLEGPHPKPGSVVVTFDPAQAQRIGLADGTQIFIPAGALPAAGPVTLRIVPIATLPHQHHALLIKYGYAFLATDGTGAPIEDHFNQEVLIHFTYEEADLWPLGIPETWLKPGYFSTTTNEWTLPTSYVIDTDANEVVMHIDHFTDFALTGTPPAGVLYLPVVVQ